MAILSRVWATRAQARADCERFMGTKVYLQTWVRVKENWRDSQFLISNFGYDARQ